MGDDQFSASQLRQRYGTWLRVCSAPVASRLHGKAFARLHPPRALITRYPADRAALWQGGEEQ
ncbi:MAG: hypothetical protein ACPIOQ_60760 [Promethearchaeia archaeon]